MAIFLQVRVGAVHLLLDALRVSEVMGMDTLTLGAQGHVEWRRDVLHAVDLGDFLQVPHDAPDMGVVYSPDDSTTPLLLKVNEVLGLRDLVASDWHALPRIPVASAAFFESVWLEPHHDRQSFRLRHPIELEIFER